MLFCFLFFFLEFKAPISVNYNKVKLVFKKSAQLKINLKKPEKAIFFANSAKNTDVKSILMYELVTIFL